MLRLVFTAACGLLFSISYGQLKKFYSLRESDSFDTVAFSLEATSGNCLIKSGYPAHEGPLTIYGNPDLNKINPSYKTRIINNTCMVRLDLQEFRSSSLSDGLAFAMLGGPSDKNNYWKIHFDDDKVYKLNLNYGFGNADVDLSGTAVKVIRIRSGSADIMVDYHDQVPNKICMDTFFVKVDMGTLVARHMELTKARHVIASIGFGEALLDFSDKHQNRCQVQASIGAGNLEIFIPREDVPIIIYLKDSPLCGIRMAPGFEEVERNVFVNMNYLADAENLLTFNIDVALGNVSFLYRD